MYAIRSYYAIAVVADADWTQGQISEGKEVWYKVTCEATDVTATVIWADLSEQSETKDYTGDILVSAYQLDGKTAYLEGKDNGFSKPKSFALAGSETAFLIKVTMGESQTPGSYAIKATAEPASVGSVVYTDLTIGEPFTQGTIALNQVVA